MSGIRSINSDTAREIVAFYNMQGIRVSNPSVGLYIVRYTDGTTAKVLVK